MQTNIFAKKIVAKKILLQKEKLLLHVKRSSTRAIEAEIPSEMAGVRKLSGFGTKSAKHMPLVNWFNRLNEKKHYMFEIFLCETFLFCLDR